MKYTYLIFLLALSIVSCQQNRKNTDAVQQKEVIKQVADTVKPEQDNKEIKLSTENDKPENNTAKKTIAVKVDGAQFLLDENYKPVDKAVIIKNLKGKTVSKMWHYTDEKNHKEVVYKSFPLHKKPVSVEKSIKVDGKNAYITVENLKIDGKGHALSQPLKRFILKYYNEKGEKRFIFTAPERLAYKEFEDFVNNIHFE